jgi:nucleoporin p58/p45
VPELKPLFSSLGTAPLGSSQLPQQQVVPGVKIDVSNLKPTTRFFELHEDLQKTIELIDSFIQSQIQLSTQCEVFLPAHGNIVKSIPPDVEYVQNKYDTVTQALDRDTAELRAVKDAVSLDIDEARRAFSAIENLKLPAQYQYSGMWASKGAGAQDESEADNFFTKTDLMPYFEKRSTDLEKRLNKFNEQVLEIEAHLRTVEDSAVAQTEKLLRLRAGRDTSKERVMELAGAMRGFEDAVFRVASKVGESREGVIECTIGSISGNGARAPFHGRLAR